MKKLFFIPIFIVIGFSAFQVNAAVIVQENLVIPDTQQIGVISFRFIIDYGAYNVPLVPKDDSERVIFPNAIFTLKEAHTKSLESVINWASDAKLAGIRSIGSITLEGRSSMWQIAYGSYIKQKGYEIIIQGDSIVSQKEVAWIGDDYGHNIPMNWYDSEGAIKILQELPQFSDATASSITLFYNQDGNIWRYTLATSFGGTSVHVGYPLSNNYWSQIQNAPNWLRLRDNHNLTGNIIKTVPNGWAVRVLKTIDDNGNNIDIDGYRWYQVQDVTDGTIGWMVAKNLTDGIVYLDYNSNNQTELQNRAEIQLDTTDERKPVILEAVNNYHTKDNSDNSLYGGGGGRNGNNNFQTFIQGAQFPKELVLAMISQESGPSFDNKICSGARDGGIGIMQITSIDLKGLGSGLDNFSHKNDCDSRTGWVGGLSDYYSNASQGIYANIKDGFRALQNKYNLIGITKAVDNISALEMKAISTIYRYNQGSPYRVQAVYAIYSGENNDYVWNEYLDYIYSSRVFADVWTEEVRSACASSTTFVSCLNKTESLGLTTSAFYLRDVGGKLKISPFGTSYQNTILGDKLIAANTSKIIAFLRSPAELTAINSLGEKTGIVQDRVTQNIPNSIYEEDKNLLTMFFPEENYTYRVTGTTEGEYGFTADLFQEDNIIIFDGKNIPIKSREVHDYTFDWDKMSRCEKGAVILKIDYEGDGIFDRIIVNDCKLYDIGLPQIIISAIENEYLLNSNLQINFSATDNISGVASIIATLNGVEITSGQMLILNKAGINLLKVVAVDNEGNEMVLEKSFNVVYNFGGFLPPIKSDGSGVYNLGRTLPVKFQLTDVSGSFISTASAQLYIAKIADGVIGTDEIPLSTSSADTGNQFRYDFVNNQYIYNLSTDTLGVGTWQLKAILDSEQVHTATISIR